MGFSSHPVQNAPLASGSDMDSSHICTLNDFYCLVNFSLPTLPGSPKVRGLPWTPPSFNQLDVVAEATRNAHKFPGVNNEALPLPGRPQRVYISPDRLVPRFRAPDARPISHTR